MIRPSAFQMPVFFALMAICLISVTVSSEEKAITLVAAGDVDWSVNPILDGVEFGSIFLDPGATRQLDGGWFPVPRLLATETMANLQQHHPEVLQRYRNYSEVKYGFPTENNNSYILSKSHDLTFSSDTQWANYPFQKVRRLFREADIAFINLETPLSDDAPQFGGHLTPSAFTTGIVDAGIDLVSLANNHAMDAMTWGLYDTFEALDKAGVHYVGAGKNLEQARQPYIVEKDGIKIAFLAYSQYVNIGEVGFATPGHAGVVPLDPLVIKEDIKRVRDSVDHVILSFHWGIFSFDKAQKFDVHADAISFAHEMIDAGADAILGHHPHIPRAVEFYKGKPILYSLSHLIMSFTMPTWVDNYVARLNISKNDISSVDIIPVAGTPQDMAQPYVLNGERARVVLDRLQEQSIGFGGSFRIVGEKGVLTDK